jgi:hypothetical protein
MASQYTKDITKSKVYKQATGQDEKLIDEIIGGLGVIKKFGDSKVAANMKTLQDDKRSAKKPAKKTTRKTAKKK